MFDHYVDTHLVVFHVSIKSSDGVLSVYWATPISKLLTCPRFNSACVFTHRSVQLQILLSMCILYYLSNTDPPEPLHLQLLSYVTELFLSPG